MAIPAIYDLYSKIVLEALAVSKVKLNKCRCDFMIEIFMLYLSIPSRINFLQLGRYRLLFSTDTEQAPIDVIDIYHTRFQIEFGFRDAKQFTGLENSQARSGNKLHFHFNTALTTVNIAKIMQLSNPDTRENSFSMLTYKVLFHNALLLSRFFSLFAINPNSIKNHQHVKELLNFGTLAA